MNKDYLMELQKINKSFYGSYALHDVDFNLKEGEIHILCGENGAGKSTLMKILAGTYKKDSGQIYIDGELVKIESPMDAEKNGISIVFQELSLSPTVTVAENMFMNREFGKFFINKKKMNLEAKKYLDMVGAKFSPDLLVRSLSVANMQLVQIAKSLSMNSKIIIMDEPCSSLTEDEANKLFGILLTLKNKGVSIIYIDHRIENFHKIGDRITVLRDAEIVDTLDIADTTKEQIIKLMVGRELNQVYMKTSRPQDQIALKVVEYTNKMIKNVSFEVRRGEVFGLAGLVGAGRSEICRAIFGVDKIQKTGRIYIDGQEIIIKKPLDAIRHGLGYVPEDRKLQSLVLFRTILFNMSLVFLNKMRKSPFINQRYEYKKVDEQIKRFNIKTMGKSAFVNELSGGNQQKVVLGRWLMIDDMKIFLLDEPTRGVDIGVKADIYKLIDRLANEGISIILVTSELPELIGLCDRIAVIRDGQISGILDRESFSQTKIMELCV
jgi:ABC-type sugar transport system ATPase subunit